MPLISVPSRAAQNLGCATAELANDVPSSAWTLVTPDFCEIGGHRMQPARAAGYSHTRIIFRHMAPNVVAPYLIMLTAFVAQAILAEASLSFLGLGVQEPTAAWGLMLSGNAADFYRQGFCSRALPSALQCSPSIYSATACATTSIHASRCSQAIKPRHRRFPLRGR